MAHSKDHKANRPPIFGMAHWGADNFLMDASKRSKWISQKIAKLRREGKSQEQAAAIAYDMWERINKEKKKKKK